MLICLRTTLNLDDALMRAARVHAAESGRTLTEVVEQALRELLLRERTPSSRYRLKRTTVRGGVQPGVDLTDRDSLLDLMEGRH